MFHGVKACPSAKQEIAANKFVAANYGLTLRDTASYFSPDKPDRIVIPAGAGGDYDVKARIHTDKGCKVGGVIYAWLVLSNKATIDIATLTYAQGQDNTLFLCADGVQLVPGDFLQVFFLHGFDKPLPLTVYDFGNWLSLSMRGDPAADDTPPPTPIPVPLRGEGDGCCPCPLTNFIPDGLF